MMIGYLRLSTADQTGSARSAALRSAGCRALLIDRGPGRRLPELERAVQRLHRGDVLVVDRLDQLGFELADVIARVKQIDARGAHLRAIESGIDTTSTGGRAVFQVVAAIAEVDRSQRSERAVRGMRAAQQRGKHVGRPPKLNSEQIHIASSRIAEGEELVDVARSFQVSALTLRRALEAHRHLRSPVQRQSA